MSLAASGALVTGFVSAAAGLFYTYLGYPVLIGVLGAARDRAGPRHGGPAAGEGSRFPEGRWPALSVVVAARDEGGRIGERLDNLLDTDYPGPPPEVLVVSDGSEDETADVVRARGAQDPNVRLLETGRRAGKPACLNLAAAAAGGEVIVFADARQRFERSTLTALVAPLEDPRVGAVSGELRMGAAGSPAGRGVDLYWKLERWVRRAESRFDSCVGCTGAVYAVRRELFRDLPEDTLLDDVLVPMQVALQGYRVRFEPGARAFDPQPLEPDHERVRKARTLAGNYQLLCRYPGWLLPWRNRLWWQLVSHKYLRLAGPFLLALLLLTTALLALQGPAAPFFAACLGLQVAFYGLAALGLGLPGLRGRIFSAPAGFVFLNAMALAGLLYFLRGGRGGGAGWASARVDP